MDEAKEKTIMESALGNIEAVLRDMQSDCMYIKRCIHLASFSSAARDGRTMDILQEIIEDRQRRALQAIGHEVNRGLGLTFQPGD